MRCPFPGILFSALVLCSYSAFALDATYLTLSEPKGWHCTHQDDAWMCVIGDAGKPAAVFELKATLLAPATKMDLTMAAQIQHRLGALANGTQEALRYQHRVSIAGLDWTEAMKTNSQQPGMTTHQWVSVLPTQHGPFTITMTAGYLPSTSVAAMDKVMTGVVRSVRLSQHVLDYVDYLSVPKEKRDAALPVVAVGPLQGAKIPTCAVNKKMEMTVGSGKLMAYPLRATGVAVAENSRALEILPTHIPYVMTTLLFSPMAQGHAEVFFFDRNQKCKVHYAVAIQPDATRTVATPHEWTTQTIRTPSSATEATAEYARLGTAAAAGHLETGNPVGAIPFPSDGTMWISDPRIFDTVRLQADKNHLADKMSSLAMIAKRPGTTTLVVMEPNGHGHGYRITVDARTMRVSSMPMGQFENEL